MPSDAMDRYGSSKLTQEGKEIDLMLSDPVKMYSQSYTAMDRIRTVIK